MGITAIALPFLGGIGAPELIILLFLIPLTLLPLVFLWRVFERVGMAGAYSLLMLVPWIGLPLVIGVLAYSRWPVLPQGAAPGSPIVTAPLPPQVTPAGWYPDPNGEHAQRYWDGAAWTSDVRS